MFKRQALRRSLVAGTAMLLWTAPLPLFAQNFSKDMKASASSPIVYPPSKKVEQVDDYHGINVADPYRWLEDADSPETKAWVEAQNKVTFGFLESIPERARLRERLTQLWNYEKFGVPFREGDRYFFTRNDGLQNQSVLYVGRTPDDPQARVLLDPNTLSSDGTVALTGYAVSDDGQLLAYGLATAGSDWNEWRVRNVETGEDLPDRLQWVKFSGASWTKDGKGFFTAAMTSRRKGICCNPRTTTRNSTTTAWARRSRRMNSFTSAATTRNGVLAAMSPMTGGIWALSSPWGRVPETCFSTRI